MVQRDLHLNAGQGRHQQPLAWRIPPASTCSFLVFLQPLVALATCFLQDRRKSGSFGWLLCRERGIFPSSFWFQFCMEGTFIIHRDGPSSSQFTTTLFIVVAKWLSLILTDDSPWFPVSHKVLFAIVLSSTSLPSRNQGTKTVCQADALAEMTPAACHGVGKIRR